MKKTVNDLWAESLDYHLEITEMTRAEFAKRMGVSEACVYGWLGGGTVTLANLEKAAKVFGVNPCAMLRGGRRAA